MQLISVDHLMEYEWKAEKLVKKLKFHQDRCIGCGLCVKVCPEEAIMLGPVKEVAAGEIEAPLIIIDETKCVVCPLCSAICPLNAITVEFKNKPEYLKAKGKIEVDQNKCLPCLLCEKICPRNAIKAEIRIPKKEELVEYETEEIWAEGAIKIDEEKCVYCGLCEILCDAIKIVWSEPKPPDYKPALTILLDEEKCDYCKLCEDICPVQAIKVECKASAPRKVLEVKIEGRLEIDENECIYCKLCEFKCPVEAIKVEKIFEGEVEMTNLEKCDPSGCKNCINICPANSIYVPKKEKGIKISDKSCIYCGACEEACPEQVLRIIRRSIRIEASDSLWDNPLRKYLLKVLEGYTPPQPEVYARPIRPVKKIIKIPASLAVPPKSPGFKTAKEIISKLADFLRERKIRFLLELGRIEKLREILTKD